MKKSARLLNIIDKGTTLWTAVKGDSFHYFPYKQAKEKN